MSTVFIMDVEWPEQTEDTPIDAELEIFSSLAAMQQAHPGEWKSWASEGEYRHWALVADGKILRNATEHLVDTRERWIWFTDPELWTLSQAVVGDSYFAKEIADELARRWEDGVPDHVAASFKLGPERPRSQAS